MFGSMMHLERCLLLGVGVLLGTATTAAARDGDPDAGFGALGSVAMPFPGGRPVEGSFVDVERLPDSKLLVSTTVDTGTVAATDMGVLRLHADGTLDTGFGVGGAAVIGFDRPGSDNFDMVRGLAVQPDGRIVLVGDAAGGTGGIDMAVVRLTAGGLLDGSFGIDGKTTVAFDLGSSPARRNDQGVKIIVLADGRLLLGGMAATAAGATMAVARLTANGALDASFDGDGRRILNFGGGLSDVGSGFNVLASADGQRSYVVGTASIAGNADFAIARLLDDGSLDAMFGGDGTVRFGFDVGGTLTDIATDVVELADGKSLLCGISQVAAPSNADFACIRLLANGTVDGDFPPVLLPFDLDGRRADEAIATRLDAQGRILVAGYASVEETSFDFALARLLHSGQVDPSFGVDGRMVYDGSNGTEVFNRAYALALQPDGKIVLAGSARIKENGDHHVQLVRVIGDTLFDSGFEASLR